MDLRTMYCNAGDLNELNKAIGLANTFLPSSSSRVHELESQGAESGDNPEGKGGEEPNYYLILQDCTPTGGSQSRRIVVRMSTEDPILPTLSDYLKTKWPELYTPVPVEGKGWLLRRPRQYLNAQLIQEKQHPRALESFDGVPASIVEVHLHNMGKGDPGKQLTSGYHEMMEE